MLQGFLPFQLTPNIRIHLMREDIKDPRKLAAEAGEIWQSVSNRSVNVVSAASPSASIPEEAALNSLG